MKYTLRVEDTRPPALAIYLDETRITSYLNFPVWRSSWNTDTDALTGSRENMEYMDGLLKLVTDANASYDPRLQATINLLVEAADEALAYLNMDAQRHLLGLDDEADDVRQAVARALTAARGHVLVGNLRRTDELHDLLEYTKPVAPKVETT